MDSSSMIILSPSFSRHSSKNLADIADRVVQELRTENGLDDDIFSFNDDDNQEDNGEDDDVNTNTLTEEVEENDLDADEKEFEFPVVCREDSNSSPISTDEVLTERQISLRYPLFDRSLLLDVDPNFSKVVDSSETGSKPAPAARLSLRKLFSEERDSSSSSSSEADDLDGIMPGTYCVWKPKTEPPQTRGTHRKSNSISIGNTSKKWKVRDLLKRSYSDDNYSTGKDMPVILCTPPIIPKHKTINEKVKKIEKTAKVASAVDGSATYAKTDNKNILAHRARASGDHRLPPYLPYRPDQVGVFANFNGSSKNLYRY